MIGFRVLPILVFVALSLPCPLPAQDAPPPKDEDTPPPQGPAPITLPPPPQVKIRDIPPKDTSKTPSSVSVILGEDLRALGVRFLPDALRSAPGLEIQRLSSTESNVTMRGYNDDTSAAQGIMGFIDGRSVYNEFFGAVIWETLPVSMDDIESVTVIRGPSSFLYGPNAMHGLVNVETKSPLDYENDEVFLSGSYGSYDSVLSSLIYVRREENVGFKAKVALDDISEFDPRGKNAKDKVFLEGRLEARLGEDQFVELTGGIASQKFNVLIPQFAGLPAAQFENESEEPYLKLDYSLGDLKAKFSWSRFDATGNPDAVYAPFHVVSDTLDIDVQYSISPLEDHTLTGGTGWRWAAFETEDVDVSNGRHETGLVWVFIQDDYQAVEDRLWLTGGVRIDSHSVAGGRFSPRLAVVWRVVPDAEHFVRASAGSGFRNPSLRELWFNMPVLGGAGTIIGNKDLEPERMRSFEVGYWGRPIETLQLTATAYYNRIDDLVEFRALNPTTFGPLNVFNEEAFGLELGAEYQFSEWLWGFGNYTYGVRRDRATHTRNPMAPRHKGNAGLRIRYPNPKEERYSAMVWATFFDDITFIDTASATPVGSTDEYVLVNARAAYRLPVDAVVARVFIQAFNLFDDDHREQPPGDSYGLILTGGLEVTW